MRILIRLPLSAAGGSALTWQDEQPPSEEDVETGFRLQGSAYSGAASSHEEQQHGAAG